MGRGESFERALAVSERLRANIETVVYGKSEQIRLIVAALACEGHVLLEDVPGTAKTVLARSVAGSIRGSISSRIQCTPDLQPTDVTGLAVWDPRERAFEFHPGPIFANVVVVDEINRALPKAQSALLEGMAERQVTVDGVTRPLPDPFLVIATENTIEQEGTFPLPEAQLDRFLLSTSLGYPALDEEIRVLDDQLHGHPLERLQPVIDTDDVKALVLATEYVYVDPIVKRWAVELVRATRGLDLLEVGASVRGSLALERVARAWALGHGRDYVIPADLELLFRPVLLHRFVLAEPLLLEELDAAARAERVWKACLEAAPRPEPDWDISRPAEGEAPVRAARQ